MRELAAFFCDPSRQDTTDSALTALLESMSDAVYFLDMQWRFVYVNARAEALLRRERAALLGQSFWEEFPETRGTALEGEFRLAVATGTTSTFEVYATTRDMWVEVSAHPCPAGLRVCVRDRTASRFAEEALRESETRYRALVEQIPAAVYLNPFKGSGLQRYVSPHIFALTGYTPEEWLGARGPVGQHMHPDDRERVLAEGRESAKSGDAFAAEYRLLHRHGGATWIRDEGFVVRDATGQPAYWQGLMIDITERKLAEEARRASELGLAEAQRIAHLGSWDSDLRAGTMTWSDETFRIFGFAPQAFVPTQEWFIAHLHPEDRGRVRRAIEAAIGGGPDYDLEMRLMRPDGSIRTVHVRGEIIADAAGIPLRLVGTVLDITARTALEARLAYQATHDPLTGLPNRTLFHDRVGQALARIRRGQGHCAVLFLDLDRFKDVNDSLGHDAGDRLLVAVAERLRGALRDQDTLARLGGDEFTVLLDAVDDATEAVEVAERLAAALAPPILLEGHEERVTASVGVVLSDANHDRAEDMLRDADMALYRAKDEGRAGYALFNPAMQEALSERRALERDLWRALEGDQFTLHYQPIVDLRSGRMVEAEALLRWDHPERGMVAPDRFVPLAEACGAIRPLGRWVLQAACRQGRTWLDAYPDRSPLTIAVNLSMREFRDTELVNAVAAALAESRLPAHLLRLEITESAAMEDAEVSLRALGALRDLGVRLAIDDFGTGYSSLAYLQRFPVDTLKIDRAFIGDLATDERSAGICDAIVTLARTLRLQVIAEGIEVVAQASTAINFGCDRAQGHYFSQPLSSEGLAALWEAEVRFDLPGGVAAAAQPMREAQAKTVVPSVGAFN